MKLLKKLKKVLKKEENEMTFEKVANEWLEYKKNEVKQSTYYNYLFIINKYLKPEFENKKMEDMQNYNDFVQKLSQTLEPRTVRGIINRLKAILKYYEDEYDCVLQVKRIAIPKLNKNKIQILGEKERKKLENYCINEGSLKAIRNCSLLKYWIKNWRDLCVKMEKY